MSRERITKKITRMAQANPSGFLPDFNPDKPIEKRISYSTAKNAHKDDSASSFEDYKNGLELQSAINSRFKEEVKATLDTVDLWVIVTVEFQS